MSVNEHFVYGAGLFYWANGYAHSDADYFELGHELGKRVHHALRSEEDGWGPLMDLVFELDMRSKGEIDDSEPYKLHI